MTSRRAVLGLGLLLLIGSVLTTGFGAADQAAYAGKKKAKSGAVEKKFGGKVLLSDKRFPMTAKSASAYISKLKKQSKAKFWENKDTKTWKIYLAAFFKKPLPDIEYQLKVYDVTNGSKSVLVAIDQYADSAGGTSVISNITLERQFVGVNKSCLITIEANGRVVASGKFQILGEAEHYSGKVDFSDDSDE